MRIIFTDTWYIIRNNLHAGPYNFPINSHKDDENLFNTVTPNLNGNEIKTM